jgi:hypothetical protein
MFDAPTLRPSLLGRFVVPALVAASLTLPALVPAQDGPITSRLTTANFILMKGWWSSDHNATTPVTFNYIRDLAIEHGVTIDTVDLNLQGQDALSAENLATYDVMMWYNVFRMYHNMNEATRTRIEEWYDDGNRGFSCFHQCVRAADNNSIEQGNTWHWWHDLMGQPYTYFAGQGNGPVYVDTEARAHVYGGGNLPPGDSVMVNDEFYNYAGPVRGTPGTQIQLTTKRSRLPSNWSFEDFEHDEDLPVAWIREYNGGRFALNGLFHTNQVTNTNSSSLRAFFDSTIVGTMRFLAGYDGCTDSNYVEYNPKATHMAEGACVTPTFIKVGSVADARGIRIDGLKIAAPPATARIA